MSRDRPPPPSSYLEYLPAVLREGPFLGRFLLGFEALLSGWVAPPAEGAPDPMPVGLDYALDTIANYFDPARTPPEFLDWLAQWVALALRSDWPVDSKRSLIARIVPLYRLRGTKGGIVEALQAALGESAAVLVEEQETPAHYFKVTVTMGVGSDTEQIQRSIRMVNSLVEHQKPAHTFYTLVVQCPKLQVLDDPVLLPGGAGPDMTKGIWVRDDLDDAGAVTLGSADPISGGSNQ